jgi:hypothetical protein
LLASVGVGNKFFLAIIASVGRFFAPSDALVLNRPDPESIPTGVGNNPKPISLVRRANG